MIQKYQYINVIRTIMKPGQSVKDNMFWQCFRPFKYKNTVVQEQNLRILCLNNYY